MLQNATVQISMELWGAILCVIFAAFIFIGEDKKTRRGNLLMALLCLIFLILISDSAAWAYRGDPSTVGYYAVRISNFLVFILNYPIAFVAMLFLESLLETHQKKMDLWAKYLITGLCLLGILMVTVSQFTGFLYTFDAQNRYQRAGGYWSICVVAAAALIVTVLVTLHYSHGDLRAPLQPLLFMFLLGIVATAVQALLYGISLVNLAMVVGVINMFFAYERERVAIQSELRTKLLEKELSLAHQRAELAQKEAEVATINAQLVEQRTQIMLSQIQPHFLYNVLSAISTLCLRRPMQAKETVDNFAMYLRANLNSLQNDHMIPFTEELEHTKAYLAIEQVRFGEDLSIVYDIQCEDFLLPSLSVQPMAENAVRHGICGSEEGGTVTIRTERKDGAVVITVQDDGVGFDTSTKPQDGRTHIGMESVMQRVRTLCGGTMVIDSAPGFGTTVTITLPQHS